MDCCALERTLNIEQCQTIFTLFKDSSEVFVDNFCFLNHTFQVNIKFLKFFFIRCGSLWGPPSLDFISLSGTLIKYAAHMSTVSRYIFTHVGHK